MRKTMLALAATLLLGSALARAQSAPAPNPCPRYGTPQQGQGPKDGTGYGAKSGKRAGPKDGSGVKARPSSPRRGR